MVDKSTPFLSRSASFLKAGVVAAGVSFLAIYLIVVLNRITYPFELEWMEGSMVDHVARILSGEKLYVAPSINFVPFLYAPLYFYVSAALSKLIGVGFLPLRIISFLSSAGVFCIMFMFVKRETGKTYWGLVASCLFIATFRKSGAWLDLARVDSLFLLLLLTALYLIKFHDSLKAFSLAGMLFSLAFLTKQTALYSALPAMLYCLIFHARLSSVFIAVFVLCTGGSTLLLNYISDGWYNFYIFKVPTYAPVIKEMITRFWTHDLLFSLPIAAGFSIVYFFIRLQKGNRKNWCFYLLTLIGMLSGAWFSRLRSGAYDNALIPPYAIISMLCSMGMFASCEVIPKHLTFRKYFIAMCLYGACLLQFAGLAYNPLKQIPGKMDETAGIELISFLSAFPGDILMPFHGYLPVLAGKKSCAHLTAVADILSERCRTIKMQLNNEILEAIKKKQFSAIILDAPWNPFWPPELEKYYTIDTWKYKSPTVFLPVTGRQVRPLFICLPRNQ